jgi:DNA-binding NarL/FixJ family response regulator
MNAEEIGRRENAMRKKLNLINNLEPVIAAAVAKYKLTKRETDMLHHLKHGKSNNDIAAELFLSTETVKIHVRNLMRKLPVDGRNDIAAWLAS